QTVYFDGPGGSQVVKSVIDSMVAYMTNGGANLHGAFPSSRETESIIEQSKQAVADMFGASSREVAFGANMTTLAFAIARALGKTFKPGEEIVVSEIDHRANVDPWLTIAADREMNVRWLPVDTDKLTLDLSNLEFLITEKTRVVTIGFASNAVGTINDVARITRRAKEVGALVVVDAVHAVPHVAIDRDQLNIDILLCSAYKFFGPHVGIAVIKSDIFKSLQTYKLSPAPTHIPDKLETGTQNHEGIAGIKPAIDFIATLGDGETRKEKIKSGLMRIEAHENRLASKIRDGIRKLPLVKLYQASDDTLKTPTIAFRVDGISPEEVCRWMCEEHSIFIASGDFYATTLADKLGINESGGWVRVGLAPYNSEEEVERFLVAVTQLVQSLKVKK
ncbi:MAG: cysteine desulfurase-like protein, partial [Bacilli bacterium]